MSRETVRLSVRTVVEMTLHDSDLAPAAAAAERMREGAAAHRARQSAAGGLLTDYRKETALSADYEGEALLLHVTGRADGIYTDADGLSVIEEIKLGQEGAPLVPAHRAQAAMYGHMLASKEGLSAVRLCVLYVGTDGERLAEHKETLDAEALHAEFMALCAPACAWEEKKRARKESRNASLENLAFPFGGYRAGQRQFAANVYVAIRDRKRLFAQAPTGIGKTMAALYPALRALGEKKCARVLFLAARTTGRRSAMDALLMLHQSGAAVLAAEIAAKDKVCFLEQRDCRPESCPYAKGFYDRLPAALSEALSMHVLAREEIAQLARRHGVCPFELSLEIAVLADAVVCDYNYVFDPVVAIDRLMEGGACLLIDEAHQLAPRVKDTYSAQVSLDDLRGIRREAGRQYGRGGGLYKAMTGAIRALEHAAEQPDFGGMEQPPKALDEALERVRSAAGELLSKGGGKTAADAFSMSSAYLFAAERFDSRYALLASGGEKHAAIELALLDAAPEIMESTKRARGTVYFSATLAPFDAAKLTLGSEEGDACLMLPSPFDPAQLDARVEPVDIRYASRERTAPQVAEIILRHIAAHEGNTIVFFPSYAYMARIYELLLGMDGLPDMRLLKEQRGMSEDDKNALLHAFEETGERTVLLAVLGGAFSEGVDLPGEQLQNVIIVSTGMPQPDERVRAMQAYYDGNGQDGFFLAMTLPGMIRVIQAAGRLIRTESDTGTLLLIDSRYNTPKIRGLLCGTLIGDALSRR